MLNASILFLSMEKNLSEDEVIERTVSAIVENDDYGGNPSRMDILILWSYLADEGITKMDGKKWAERVMRGLEEREDNN